MAVQPRKDVVVIGYGAAGGPIATELALAGYSVVALERGPHMTTQRDFAQAQLDTLRWVTRGGMLPRFADLPFTFRTSEDAVARPTRYTMSNMVGGASVHWSGQSWRFFEEDFRVRSTVLELYGEERLRYLAEDGAALADWPLTYDEVEPYYAKAETHVGIGGWPGNIQGRLRPVDPQEGNPFEAPRQDDFPFRPLRDNATDLTFRQGALELGLHPFHVPTAITTVPYMSPYGVSRPPCTYCTFCTSHGCWNASKSSSLVSLLPAAQATGNFELRADANVLRLNHEGGRVSSVDYVDTVTGETHTQPGDIFYLGAYTYQNVRLLLHSGLDGNGMVGKYFMSRSAPSVHAIFSDRMINGYNGPAVQRQAVDNYNGEVAFEEKANLSDDDLFIRGSVITSPSQRNPLQSYNIVPDDTPTWGAAYKAHLRENLNRFISLQFVAEPMPYESSYLDLDPNFQDEYGVPGVRVTRQVKENEQRMGRFLFEKGSEIMRASGASRVWGSPEVTAVASSTHDTGGCRMGVDPTQSVTNRYGQVWDAPNLFVGGGALFPSMAGKNPTQTIWMLSYWTADAIVGGRVDLGDSQAYG